MGETVLDFIGLPSLFNDLRDYASPDLGTAGAECMDFDYASPDPGTAGAVITQVPTLVRRAPSTWTLIMQVPTLVWRAPTNFMKAYCLRLPLS